MKGTIFQKLNGIYTLKIPSKKILPKSILSQAESLALCFYKFIICQKMGTSTQRTFLENQCIPKQNIRQSYTNLFYSLNHKSQKVLDFIACIICLLNDVIFAPQYTDENEKMVSFLQNLQKKGQKFSEYLYIVYTFETIGLNVSRQSASVLFQQFILTTSQLSSSLTTRTRLNMQIKEVKKNFQDQTQSVNIKHRLIKIGRNKKASIFKEEIDKILLKNKIEIQEEERNNKKFQKLLIRCLTEGKNDIDPNLIRKSLNSLKLNDILKTMKNTQKSFRPKKKTELTKEDQSKSYEHWQKIINEMRVICELGNTVLAESISSPRFFINKSPYHIPKQNSNKNHISGRDPLLKRSRIMNKYSGCPQTEMRYKSMLPILKYNKKITQTEPNEKIENTNGKLRKHKSKQFKNQYQKFMTERALKKIL